MPQLSQIVAVEKGLKGRTQRQVTDIYHNLKKRQLFEGLTRTYTPREDGGEQLPPESKHVQNKAPDLLDEAATALKQLFDVVATKENGNRFATGTVRIGDQVIVADVSVPFLLFLGKQLTDWRTEVSAIPVLDPASVWYADGSVNNLFRTDPVETVRSKKIPRNHVKAEATDRHPAQVDVYYEDVPVGTWSKTELSGAVPARRRDELVARADKLLDAVKQAREEANSTEVSQQQVGSDIFAYLLQ
jgi:hypothetical protein